MIENGEVGLPVVVAYVDLVFEFETQFLIYFPLH